jgi:hypothetical protein
MAKLWGRSPAEVRKYWRDQKAAQKEKQLSENEPNRGDKTREQK